MGNARKWPFSSVTRCRFCEWGISSKTNIGCQERIAVTSKRVRSKEAVVAI